MNLRVIRQLVRRVRSRYPVLLLNQRVAWRREPDLAVFGFTVLWSLAALSLVMLSWRLNDLANLTAGHWQLAMRTGGWWRCIAQMGLLAGASLWVNLASGGSPKEARRRLGL